MVTILFSVLIVGVAMLAFQVHTTSAVCKLEKTNDQTRIQTAAKRIVQSGTQTHVLFAYQHALEAQFIANSLIDRYNGVPKVESELKLPRGQFKQLVDQINDQVDAVQNHIMEHVIRENPTMDTHLNELAGIQRRSKRRASAKASTTSSRG